MALPMYALDGDIVQLKQTGKAFASVARSVSPSVAFIQVESIAPDSTIPQFSSPFGDEWPFGGDMFRRFFGDDFRGIPRSGSRTDAPPGKRQTIGQGSGFVFAVKNELISAKTFLPIIMW